MVVRCGDATEAWWHTGILNSVKVMKCTAHVYLFVEFMMRAFDCDHFHTTPYAFPLHMFCSMQNRMNNDYNYQQDITTFLQSYGIGI
jgi:hypothetical protein